MSNYFDILSMIAWGALLVSLFADILFKRTWNRIYFSAGLPLFVMRVPVERQQASIPGCSVLENEFQSKIIESLLFKEFDKGIYGFRRKTFQFKLIRTFSVMHGLLVFDRDNNQVIVKGFVDWSLLSFSLLGIPIAIYFTDPLIPLTYVSVPVLAQGISYLIQRSRYSKVGRFAAEAWSLEDKKSD